MSGKVYIKTHGCQMNEYDSDKMADVLSAVRGMEVTQNPEEADVLLLNTCSIREKAQEKVFSQLGRWRELKENNPNVIIGVGGCVASQEGEALKARAPQVDIIMEEPESGEAKYWAVGPGQRTRQVPESQDSRDWRDP